ncbi:MAG: agmatine deiminase family protein [Trueperaceae bacterium]|nr:agmatine deiminase family protein [Trueperaceae bacterium]
MMESSDTTQPTPTELGYGVPAEWDEHRATWTSWPFDDDLWEGYLDGVRLELANLVATISRFEPVYLNVRDDAVEEDARNHLNAANADTDNLTFHRVPLNDIWFRDNGPIFIRNEAGQVALTDWEFNAWGGKYAPWDQDNAAPQAVAQTLDAQRFSVPYVMEGGALEFDGRGTCLSTRSCLLSQQRNPNLSEAETESLLRDYLGVRHVVWLERGLIDDHTDGHIDTIVRFTDPHTLVCAVSEDPDNPNHDALRRNLDALRALRDPDGNAYTVIELPLPEKQPTLNDKYLPLTYANFYIGNGFVVVPTYQDKNDERALDILRPLFPDRSVIGLPASNLITGGGAFHCVTQQQPEGRLGDE